MLFWKTKCWNSKLEGLPSLLMRAFWATEDVALLPWAPELFPGVRRESLVCADTSSAEGQQKLETARQS